MLNLKIARLMRNLKQSELAKKMEVSVDAVSAWERGKINMTTENLVKASKILDVSSDFILGLQTAEEFINLK